MLVLVSSQSLPVQVGGAATAQEVPFHVVPDGQDAVPESDAVSLPHELLAVAVQFVTPALLAAREPVPPEAGLSVYEAGLAPVQLIVTETPEPETPQPTVKLEPTVCVAGVRLKLENTGTVPHALPFQSWPDGQTQALPFHDCPPEQTLTQLEPFQLVPEAHTALTAATLAESEP